MKTQIVHIFYKLKCFHFSGLSSTSLSNIIAKEVFSQNTKQSEPKGEAPFI